MKAESLAVLAALAACAVVGCRGPVGGGSESRKPKTENQVAGAPGTPGAPVTRSAVAAAPGYAAELQALAANYREMAELCAREKLPFTAIAAKAWEMATEADALLKLAEGAKPASPDKAGAPDPIIDDVDLISIDSRRLALAAATCDGVEVKANWAKLELPCKRLFGGR